MGNPYQSLHFAQSFCHISASALQLSYPSQMQYAQAITELSQNLSGCCGTSSETSQTHLGAFTISITHHH